MQIDDVLKGKPEHVIDALAKKILLRGPVSLIDLANRLECSPKHAEAAVERLKAKNHNIRLSHAEVSVTAPPAGGDHHLAPKLHTNREYRFGVVSDNHLCSKYSRLDVLNSLYDTFEREGVSDVYNAGNMIDGECRFNTHDLLVRSGIDAQLDYLAEHYPERKGVKTHYIAGDDHEGWYVQREGLDIGKMMQQGFKDAGRTDMHYLGYLEADVKLKAPKGETWIRVMHPGGGSAYALSYAPQKIVECVPLESEILTRTGWRKHSEIIIGQEVLGYNIATDRCEWTELKAINLYPNEEVVAYQNDQFKVECTRGHRWAIEWEQRAGKNPASREPKPYTRKDRMLCTIEDSKPRSRIIQSAKAPDGPGLEINGHAEILDRQDSVAKVMRMTSAQRQSFIFGMMIGEGSLSGSGNTPVFSQRPGNVQDAFVLACFLEGKGIGIARKATKKINGDAKTCCRTSILKKRFRMVTRSLRETSKRNRPVWCPTTALGTWVMRQGDTITITGNSFQGGEKPHVLIIGHYHKMEFCIPREVFCISAGCTQDQTPFMRKNKLQAYVGGWVCRLIQATDGHVMALSADWRRYYDKGFYEGQKYPRW